MRKKENSDDKLTFAARLHSSGIKLELECDL